jgi:glycosyltransferase involved in cell wall biosynthesis
VAPRILWVRSFHELYRPQWAIGILERLLEQYPEAALCMVGPDKDGSLEHCQQLAHNKGLADKVYFTGLLSKADWLALSADYDIFLNTTSADNTPVSVMEAMALGMPVVTTKVGGIPWLFADGIEGIMVAEADEALRHLPVSLRGDDAFPGDVSDQ